MKFSITKKLLAIVSLPIFTLLIFSTYHLNANYSILTKNTTEQLNLELMKKTNKLIHELQIERGLSANVLSKNKNSYFISKLNLQRKSTDKITELFFKSLKQLDKAKISKTSQKYLDESVKILYELKNIREGIDTMALSFKASFSYYTFLNTQLILTLNSFKITTSSPEINIKIFALSRVTQLQEYAGQERGFVASLLGKNKLEPSDFQVFHNILLSQKDQDQKMHFILSDTQLGEFANKIHAKYENGKFQEFRTKIIDYEQISILQNKIFQTIGLGGMLQNLQAYKDTQNEKYYTKFLENKKTFDFFMKEYLTLSTGDAVQNDISILQEYFDAIQKDRTIQANNLEVYNLWLNAQKVQLDLDPKTWFALATQRINDIHTIENKLFEDISLLIEQNLEETTTELQNQIFITFATIFFLVFGTIIIANKIIYSINQLENGMDEFFEFLDFKRGIPQDIVTKSHDELNDIAQKINTQIEKTESNLQEDFYFIKEITQIVTLMKDGDFNERSYFEPNNPNLRDLKIVFEELIELIATKIKEQTLSLEQLNTSLEEQVTKQTLELHEQVKELTIARDKAIQAEKSKDEFLANMSHEIRTPLNAILGFVTILQKRTSEEKSLEYLKIIDSSGQSLLTIINDILDFSKIQSGKFTISPHETNPVESFSSATLLFASKAYEKHIIYAVYIDPNLPETIIVDDVRVKQILSNLLSNAIKFTPEDGSVKVKVVIEKNILLISVQDSGIGISKENQSKVFSAFEQADGSTTRKYGGTGLGLSISARLSQLMNGKLTFTSEEGKGSTFTLKVPIEIKDKTPYEFINKDKIKDYSIAILNISNDYSFQVKLIKKYLIDFGVKNIKDLDSFTEDDYDILFFIPDDEFNEDIVNSQKPSIAILRSTYVKLGDFEHIQSLYAPFTPKAIVEAIVNTGIDKTTEKE